MLISIIIPVYNESNIIEDSLSYLLTTCNKEQVEIIIVDGGSSDDTAELAKKYTDNIIVSTQKGRPFQMHSGALAAKGDLLLFLHIDSRLPTNWYNNVLSLWKGKTNDNKVASFFRKFNNNSWQYNLLGALANYWFLVTKVPHGDQSLTIHRDTYFNCGGYPNVPLMEEYVLFKQLKNRSKLIILPEKIEISSRRYELKGPFKLSLINIAIVILYRLGIPLSYLAKLYR